jgi:hypothetical protein
MLIALESSKHYRERGKTVQDSLAQSRSKKADSESGGNAPRFQTPTLDAYELWTSRSVNFTSSILSIWGKGTVGLHVNTYIHSIKGLQN